MSIVELPKRQVRDIPREGAGGFSESWYPICLSGDVNSNEIIGKPFLDGNVIIWRENDGTPHVQSGYCLHFGAGLAQGKIIDNKVVCPFHAWEYDHTGRCLKTGIGDRAPKDTKLFDFPTVERYGMIWAFNGHESTWSLPDFKYPDEELNVIVQYIGEWSIDPWMVCCNTLDFQHFKLLHGLEPDGDWPRNDEIEWTDSHVVYPFKGAHWNKEPIDFRWGIWGTTVFFQEGLFDGRWFGLLAPLGIERAGFTTGWYICVTHLKDNTISARREAESWGRWALAMEQDFAMQDLPVFSYGHFRPGVLTESDKPLARFFNYLRQFPRSHHAKEFLY
ncbi:aromatic ring-hydroxylating oxygenase subunit alpha [Sphingosinicella microcystinivorans]|nr:Rieske 2Fe-2S domain-containing protein [Sphingosinicella microcystinivorans]RKS86344.1 Rieske-like 2Fe-2S protein [Sphingosinicella microcystinivorans]